MNFDKPLFIFEMANNHMGDVEHGIRIVREFKAITQGLDLFQFSIKLQHRDESFFHPDFVNRTDYKYIKRFTETKLSKADFKRLKDEIQDQGFVSMCTPWDEPSVDLMEELSFDVIKIASCSFTDWPLLERVAKSQRPVIASTAAATLEEIDRVVSFFTHRKKSFALMHCVGEYPCRSEHLELNQIGFFKSRYPWVPIGFSTHEDPDNLKSVPIAIGMGSMLFEKHVAVPTERYAINAYSATPEQARKWLLAAAEALAMCGVKGQRREIFAKEIDDIQPLLRGAFAARHIKKGEKITEKDLFLAMPNSPGQLVARQLSKYTEFHASEPVAPNQPLMLENLEVKDLRERVSDICSQLRAVLKRRQIALPSDVEIEISHHYGIDRFEEWGAILIHVINRIYSKILVVMFPGQSYPRHRHIQKDETYHLLHGDLTVEIEGKETLLKAGDVLSINRGLPHSFRTTSGAVIEEVATTYVHGDSVYEDQSIQSNGSRKTQLKFWPEWHKQ
jgi:sialic acid synthase SpsE/mannose-6-phosphate isomerase-like protein (cupin superfamily)